MKAKILASADVFIGAVAQIDLFHRRGLFQPAAYTALLPGRITADIVEADRVAVRFATSLAGIMYNPKLAPMRPTSMQDMLKPAWKGKIATTPYLANFDFLAATDVWGPEQALAYARKLSGQVSGLIRCPEVERIMSGEYLALVLDCGGLDAFKKIEQGAPLAQAIPRDFAKLSYYYLSIPKHAQHPNAAKVYVAYLLSAEGQKLVWDTWRTDLPSLPRIQIRGDDRQDRARAGRQVPRVQRQMVEHASGNAQGEEGDDQHSGQVPAQVASVPRRGITAASEP